MDKNITVKISRKKSKDDFNDFDEEKVITKSSFMFNGRIIILILLILLLIYRITKISVKKSLI